MGTQRPQLQLKSADVWMLTYAFPFFSIASTNTSWRSKAKWKRPIKNLGIITVFLSAFCIVLSCHLTESLWLKLQGSLQHHATLGDRVDYLEKLMGDSADKHTNELGQAGKPICRTVPQTIITLRPQQSVIFGDRRPTQSWISYGVDLLLWRPQEIIKKSEVLDDLDDHLPVCFSTCWSTTSTRPNVSCFVRNCKAVGVTVESMKQNHSVLMAEKAALAFSMLHAFLSRGGSSLKFLVRQSVMLTMHPSLNVWTTLKSNLGIQQISIVWSQDISRSFQIHISYILDAISDSCSPFSVLSPRCKRHLIPRSRPKSRPCEAGPIARSPCKLRGVSEKGGIKPGHPSLREDVCQKESKFRIIIYYILHIIIYDIWSYMIHARVYT